MLERGSLALHSRLVSAPDPIALVLEHLLAQSLCLACLATLTGLSARDVQSAVRRLASLLTIAAASNACPACRQGADAFRLNASLLR
jgi:hypothetical protein